MVRLRTALSDFVQSGSPHEPTWTLGPASLRQRRCSELPSIGAPTRDVVPMHWTQRVGSRGARTSTNEDNRAAVRAVATTELDLVGSAA
jgi:hypothetical protein